LKFLTISCLDNSRGKKILKTGTKYINRHISHISLIISYWID